MADTTNTAPAQSKEGLSFAQRVRGFLDGIVTDGLNRQYKEGTEKLNAKLNEQREKALKQQQETEDQQAKEAGKVSAEPRIIVPNPIMIYAANGKEEELKRTAEMSGTETTETRNGETPAPQASAPAPVAVDVSKMSETAREAYNKTQEAVIERVAVGLKTVGKNGKANIVNMALMAGVSIEAPQDDKEYLRTAKELIENREFNIKDKDGADSTVKIGDLDEYLKGLRSKENTKKLYNEITEGLGAESFDKKIPDTNRKNVIAKAVGDSVEENTGMKNFFSAIIDFISAAIEWIGGFFKEGAHKSFGEIWANRKGDRISESVEKKVAGLGLSADDIGELKVQIRTEALAKAGIKNPDAPKPTRLEDIKMPQASPAEPPPPAKVEGKGVNVDPPTSPAPAPSVPTVGAEPKKPVFAPVTPEPSVSTTVEGKGGNIAPPASPAPATTVEAPAKPTASVLPAAAAATVATLATTKQEETPKPAPAKPIEDKKPAKPAHVASPTKKTEVKSANQPAAKDKEPESKKEIPAVVAAPAPAQKPTTPVDLDANLKKVVAEVMDGVTTGPLKKHLQPKEMEQFKKDGAEVIAKVIKENQNMLLQPKQLAVKISSALLPKGTEGKEDITTASGRTAKIIRRIGAQEGAEKDAMIKENGLNETIQNELGLNGQKLKAAIVEDVARSEGKELKKAGLNNADASYLAAAAKKVGSQQIGFS